MGKIYWFVSYESQADRAGSIEKGSRVLTTEGKVDYETLLSDVMKTLENSHGVKRPFMISSLNRLNN